MPSVSKCHQLQRSEEMISHVTRSLGSFSDSVIIRGPSSSPPSCSAVLPCGLGPQRAAPHGHKMAAALPGIISGKTTSRGTGGCCGFLESPKEWTSIPHFPADFVSPHIGWYEPHSLRAFIGKRKGGVTTLSLDWTELTTRVMGERWKPK